MANSAWSDGGNSGNLQQAFTNQTSVTVTHNLYIFPNVSVVDDTGEVIIPLAIIHNNALPASCTATTVTFSVSTSGTIVLSYGAVRGEQGVPGEQGAPGNDGVSSSPALNIYLHQTFGGL